MGGFLPSYSLKTRFLNELFSLTGCEVDERTQCSVLGASLLSTVAVPHHVPYGCPQHPLPSAPNPLPVP